MSADPSHGPAHRATVDPALRVDIVQSLLQNPLDPGYAMAAERRQRDHRSRHQRRPAMSGLGIGLLAILCGLIPTVAAVRLTQPEPDVVAARRSVEQEVQRRMAEADAVQADNAALQEEIASLRARTLSGAGADDVVARVDELALQAGVRAVRGPGLQIELSEDVEAGERGRVLDQDLQVLCNELWASGAEAIGVNGHQLTSMTAIRRAGQAVLVDLQPLVPPYTISAIGDPQVLSSRFERSRGAPYLDVLRKAGIKARVSTESTLELAPGGGTVTVELARPDDSLGE